LKPAVQALKIVRGLSLEGFKTPYLLEGWKIDFMLKIIIS
jgi:hypothetical protein